MTTETKLSIAKAVKLFHKLWIFASVALIYCIIFLPNFQAGRIISFFIVTSTFIANLLFGKNCPFAVMELYLKGETKHQERWNKSKIVRFAKERFGLNILAVAILIIAASAMLTTGLIIILF
jgi:hypothetical protein